jgi:hypothetical protein
MLARYVAPVRNSHIIRFQSDQRVAARTFVGRILWLQGFPAQAKGAVERAVDNASASNHVVSLCLVLAHAACQISMSRG